MAHNEHILLLDQGGHSSRAILFDGGGRRLADASAGVAIHADQNGRVEIDSRLIEQSLDRVLADIAAQARQLGIGRIGRAALIVQRSSFLACDTQHGQPLTPVISWMDSRNAGWFAGHADQMERIQAITGLYPNGHYAASKIRWLLDHHAGVAAACARQHCLFVPLAAWLAHYLCRTPAMPVDAVIASRTLLMDTQQWQWSDELLALFGIARTALPVIVDSDYPFGDIRAGDYRIPLQLAGGDQSFVAFAAGVDAIEDSAFVNVGSGAFIQAVCDSLPAHTRLLKSPLVKTAAGTVVALEGTVNAAASALDWLFARDGEHSIVQMEQALAEQQQVPLFLNTVAGTGSPHWLPPAPPQFSDEATAAVRLVAVLESIVFLLVDNLADIRRCKPGLRRLIVSGGLSRSDGFCRKLASLAGLPVWRSDDVEASARGAAFYLLGIRAQHSGLQYQCINPGQDAALEKRYRRHCLRLQNYAASGHWQE